MKTAPADDLFAAPTALLQDLLAVSLTAVVLLRPLYGPEGTDLVDFALAYLNPAAQRSTGLPERPGSPARAHLPHLVTDEVLAFYRRVFETGEPSRYDFTYQADSGDHDVQIAARRSGNLLLVSLTDTADPERRALERALRQSQAAEQAARAEAAAQGQHFNEVLRQLPALVATYQGPAHVYTFVNPPYQTQFPGLPLLGRALHEVLPIAGEQGIIALLDRVYQTGEPFYGHELAVQLPPAAPYHGRRLFINVVYQPLRDAQGTINGILDFSYEVTEQVVARQQVEALNQELEARVAERTRQVYEQGQRLERLFMQAPAAICILGGPELVFELINPVYQQFFPDRPLLGKPLLDALPELAGHAAYHTMRQVFDTGETVWQPALHTPLARTADGVLEDRYFNYVQQPRYDAQGRIDGVLVFGFEVSEQVRAQQRVEASREQLKRFQFMADQARDPFILIRADGSFAYLNPRALEAWGYTAEEMQPLRVPDLDPLYHQEAFDGLFARAQHEAIPLFETLHRRKDGHVYPVEVSVAGLPLAGQPHLLVVARDITERQRDEQRGAYLFQLSDALRSLAGARAIEEAATATALQFFQADRCYYCTIEEGAAIIRRDAVRPGLPSIAGVYPLDQFELFNVVLATGRPFLAHDIHTSDLVDEALRSLLQGVDIQAFLNVPVVKAGQVVGVFTVAQREARTWTELEVALAAETAERTWAAGERARAEQALQANEQRLRLTIEAADMGTWDWNLPTNLVHWNHQHFVLLGREPTPAPVTPEDFARQLHPADRAWVQQRLVAAVAHQQVFDAEFRIVRADDGQTRWVSGYGQAIEMGPVGDTRRMAGVVFDITARKQAEEALRQSEEQFRTVANLVPDLLWRSNAHGETTWYNQRWYEYTGQTPAQAAAYGWAEAIHPDERAPSARRYQEAMRTGQPLQQEHRIRSAAGEYRWFQVQARPVRDEQGQIAACFGAATDIHQLKLAAAALVADNAWLEREVTARTQALRDSQQLLQSVFDTSLTALLVLKAVRDAAGAVLDFRIVMGNQELAKATGRPDLVGKLYAEEFPGVKLTPIYERMLAVLETGEPAELEFFYPHEGIQIWCASQFVKMDDGLVVTNLDITERKQAEQEVRKNLRLLEQAEEVASLGSWDYDRRTGEFLWSAGMYRLFGLPPGSPIRPEIYRDFAVAEDQLVAERIVQGLTTGRTGFEETLRIQVGEAVRTLRVKAAGAFDAAGEPQRMLGVDLDISAVQRLEADNLHLHLTQQQTLFNAVLEAQETERRRMAESLHNGVGQTLFATKLQLDKLRPTTELGAWGQVNALLADAIRQTRTLSHELVPTVLTDFGLKAALHDISRKLSSSHLHFTCTVELDHEQPLPQLLEVALYRMAQELAQNVVKHAGASEASLTLETVPGFVLLRVEDNGIGFAAATTSGPGIGLRTIHDRVVLLGGTVDLGSTPAFGTYARLRFPLSSPPLPLT